ncbi:hypothetical protein CES85_3237 (plasmid) [Ochrobactrum quorumnocens]|uniref:Transposase n=1 Tax=Ochrobactrum quorumnocens TaxID=271865 RepID=A0A248UNF7_9HYPH|nr:hypothetical protein CES85_3237 [[Ochrobactrum] quorumnocens]
MQTSDISFKRHRFPPQIVAHAVWLYLRFNLTPCGRIDSGISFPVPDFLST